MESLAAMEARLEADIDDYFIALDDEAAGAAEEEPEMGFLVVYEDADFGLQDYVL